MSDNVNDYAAQFIVDDRMAADENIAPYIQRQIEEMEKNVIYKAVKQIHESWICIKPVISSSRLDWDKTAYRVTIHCRPVETSRVYIPVYEKFSMPKDVFTCSFCGGMTRNDQRGHCGSCGGPRNNDYLEANL